MNTLHYVKHHKGLLVESSWILGVSATLFVEEVRLVVMDSSRCRSQPCDFGVLPVHAAALEGPEIKRMDDLGSDGHITWVACCFH